jgi:hypothetical protein
MLSLLLEMRGQLRRAEAPRVLLEVCLVELCTLPTAADVGGLIARLEALEARLGGAPGLAHAKPAQATPEGRSAEAAPTARRPAPQPPVERAVAIEPAGEGDAAVRWRQVVDRVKERKLLLGTCLEEGLFLGAAGSVVRVALSPEHAFHRAMLEMKENREILNQEFERLYGRGATLVCVGTDQAVAGAGYQVRSPKPAAEGDEEAGPEPATEGLVQRIVDLFDGEILKPGPQGSGAS